MKARSASVKQQISSLADNCRIICEIETHVQLGRSVVAISEMMSKIMREWQQRMQRQWRAALATKQAEAKNAETKKAEAKNAETRRTKKKPGAGSRGRGGGRVNDSACCC